MSRNRSFRLIPAALCALAFVMTAPGTQPSAFAQSGGPPAKPPEQQKSTNEPAKDAAKKIDDIAEASRLLTGSAGNPECVWLGRRVVSRLWNDDLDAAFRHLDLYDRFGCPGAHIQATFRCLVRQGNIDPKQQETLNGRVNACWLNPGLPPPEPTSAQAPQADTAGTTAR